MFADHVDYGIKRDLGSGIPYRDGTLLANK